MENFEWIGGLKDGEIYAVKFPENIGAENAGKIIRLYKEIVKDFNKNIEFLPLFCGVDIKRVEKE